MPLEHSPDELAAWLRLSEEPGLGPVGAYALLRAAGMPEQIYAMRASALARHVPSDLARQLAAPPSAATADLIARTLQWVEAPGCHVITLADTRYPQALLTTADPPLLLYLRGNPAVLARPALAVVGARSATTGGTDNARAFARYLAAHGWCIVSGLAQGIDAAAHEGALDAGAQGAGTVAVLGTGIDVVYPPRHGVLADRIAAAGALVSEFPLGTPALPHQFPKRNRLVAGLSRGVLVVEAARQSGSLITARLAGENGREVFAIPGSIHSPLSRGCHALIRQGAKLVETARDITDELGAPAGRSAADTSGAGNARGPKNASAGRGDVAGSGQANDPGAGQDMGHDTGQDTGQDAVLDALGYDPVHVDTVLARSGLDSATVGARLVELELTGVVTRLEGGRYQRRTAADETQGAHAARND